MLDKPLTEEQIQALETGVSMPFARRALSSAFAHSKGTGTQVTRGLAEAKGQRDVPGPQVCNRRSILHARHRRVAATGARLLQQSCRVLREHGASTARKCGSGLRRSTQTRLALCQSTQQKGDRA